MYSIASSTISIMHQMINHVGLIDLMYTIKTFAKILKSRFQIVCKPIKDIYSASKKEKEKEKI